MKWCQYVVLPGPTRLVVVTLMVLSFSATVSVAGGSLIFSDGVVSGPAAIPEGARLQLDPSLDLDALGLVGYEKAVAQALQTYGMFLVDTGGSSGIGLYAIDPKSAHGNPWQGLLPDADFVGLPNIPLASFRVLLLPAPDPSWQDGLALVPSGCGSID